MKRVRIPLAAVALASAVAVMVPARMAAASYGLTDCSVSFANPTIYASDGGVSNPTSSTATIDVSSTLLKPGVFYFHVTDGKGKYTSSTEQTSSTSIVTAGYTWLQWLGDATQGTVLTLTEPLEVSVVVTNTSAYSAPFICQGTMTLMPNSTPSAPTSVTVIPGNREVTVSWTPWKNFSGQTFTVTSSPDGKTCTATYPATECVVGGLTNGREYTFTVTTTTSGGESSASDPSAPVSPQSGGGLPPTGVDGTVLILAALGLLAAGTAITRTTRRRRIA